MVDCTFAWPGWRSQGNATARGLAFDGDHTVDPAAAFDGVDSLDRTVDVAGRLGGFFAVVVETAEDVILVADRARSVPLYVSTGGSGLVVDSLDGVDLPGGLDPVAASEFALTRHVTRGETLYPTVQAVRAGEVVRVPHDRPAAFERHRYARHRPTHRERGTREPLLDRLSVVLAAVFDRVVTVADGRPVAVPLSGGWDSRLVATELVSRGVDVVGFTFGRPGHADVEVSREVASALDIRWEWVEYSPDRWHEWYHSPERRAYYDRAFCGDALPFLAEWPAVRILLDDGRLPSDALVCPGHTVATPSERVPPSWLESPPDREEFVAAVLEEHYSLWDWDDPSYRAVFVDRIVRDAELGCVDSGGTAAAAYEQWEWTTRMATFTNGDCRVYDWFDLDWWLPLWDPAYARFWASVPLEHRLGKRLQIDYTAARFAEVTGVSDRTVRRTDRDWTAFDQLRRCHRVDPTVPWAEGFDQWLGVQATPRANRESWGSHPLGWYGVVPARASHRFDAAPTLYSLRTLEALDLVSFDPPLVRGTPLDGSLDLPPVD